MSGKKLILALASSILLCGCGQPTKLTGGYTLECSENGQYYVVAPGTTLDIGGVFEGTIEMIGWNDVWILAKVNRIYDGDPDGWYALNVKTKQIRGPLRPSELKADPVLSQIQCHDVRAKGNSRGAAM